MVQEVHHDEGEITEGGLQRRHSDGIDRLPGQISRIASVSHYMNVEDIDAKIDYYANEDKSSTKTWTRIIVEKYLQNVSFIMARHHEENSGSNDDLILVSNRNLGIFQVTTKPMGPG